MRIIVEDDMPVQVREISNGIHANWPQWEVLTAGDGEEIVRLVSSKRILDRKILQFFFHIIPFYHVFFYK